MHSTKDRICGRAERSGCPCGAAEREGRTASRVSRRISRTGRHGDTGVLAEQPDARGESSDAGVLAEQPATSPKKGAPTPRSTTAGDHARRSALTAPTRPRTKASGSKSLKAPRGKPAPAERRRQGRAKDRRQQRWRHVVKDAIDLHRVARPRGGRPRAVKASPRQAPAAPARKGRGTAKRRPPSWAEAAAGGSGARGRQVDRGSQGTKPRCTSAPARQAPSTAERQKRPCCARRSARGRRHEGHHGQRSAGAPGLHPPLCAKAPAHKPPRTVERRKRPSCCRGSLEGHPGPGEGKVTCAEL